MRTHLGGVADQSDDPVFREITLRGLEESFSIVFSLPPREEIPFEDLSRTENSKDLIFALALSVVRNNRAEPVSARGMSRSNVPEQGLPGSDLPTYLPTCLHQRSRDFLFFAAGHLERVRVNEDFAITRSPSIRL